jgi:hypothetical protein
MKRERIELQGQVSVETGRDWNGRFFIAYRSGCSVFVRCPEELRKFLKPSLATASKASLDSWLDSLPAIEPHP